MPPDGTDFTGRVGTVTGWGRLKYGGGVPSVLQEVQVTFALYFQCILRAGKKNSSFDCLRSVLCRCDSLR